MGTSGAHAAAATQQTSMNSRGKKNDAGEHVRSAPAEAERDISHSSCNRAMDQQPHPSSGAKGQQPHTSSSSGRTCALAAIKHTPSKLGGGYAMPLVTHKSPAVTVTTPTQQQLTRRTSTGKGLPVPLVASASCSPATPTAGSGLSPNTPAVPRGRKTQGSLQLTAKGPQRSWPVSKPVQPQGGSGVVVGSGPGRPVGVQQETHAAPAAACVHAPWTHHPMAASAATAAAVGSRLLGGGGRVAQLECLLAAGLRAMCSARRRMEAQGTDNEQLRAQLQGARDKVGYDIRDTAHCHCPLIPRHTVKPPESAVWCLSVHGFIACVTCHTTELGAWIHCTCGSLHNRAWCLSARGFIACVTFRPPSFATADG